MTSQVGFKMVNVNTDGYVLKANIGEVGSEDSHFKKTIKRQERKVFTGSEHNIAPWQKITLAPTDYLTINGKLIKENASGCKQYEKASEEIANKLKEFAKTIPEELKNYIDVKTFKWIKAFRK